MTSSFSIYSLTFFPKSKSLQMTGETLWDKIHFTPLLSIYPEKTIIPKDTHTPMFTAALFTTGRIWKQPKCSSTEEKDKEDTAYIYTHTYTCNGIVLILKRNKIVPFVEMWMDLCYTEWRKSERENQVSYINTYMWNLEKWYRWTYLQKKNTDTDVENKCMNTKGGKREEMNWEIEIDIYTLLCIK